jgi:hypothetical protein
MKLEVSLTEHIATGSSQPAIPSNFAADLHDKPASLSPPPLFLLPLPTMQFVVWAVK